MMSSRYRFLRPFLLLALVLTAAGCTGRYFYPASSKPASPQGFALKQWPHPELWMGIVFNGARIGFSHYRISPSRDAAGLFDIHSTAYLRFRFLMHDKIINLKAYDQVAPDLTLVRFSYQYDLDGNRLSLRGRQGPDALEIEIHSSGQSDHQMIPLKSPVYPTSVIGLYPVRHGLAIGRRYTYPVYDGETRSVSQVTQDVLSYEESQLFTGPAFRIRTRLHGQTVHTWVDSTGRPLLEMSLGGVIIATAESQSQARQNLARAALHKEETLLEFSLIRIDRPLDHPETIGRLQIVFSGMAERFEIPTDARQQCQRRKDQIYCRIGIDAQATVRPDATAQNPERYLQPSYVVPSIHPSIVQTAQRIAKDAGNPTAQIRALVAWMGANIRKVAVDVFTALDVLEHKKAECQGHSYLFTAFARARGLPTRVVNGIVYSPKHQGFLYHSWAESWVNGHWLAVDPTLGQIPADATHIKFVEGENMSDLGPLIALIGRIKARVIGVSPVKR